MYTTSSDLKEAVDYKGKYYKVYYSSEPKEGRGKCHVCGRNKRYFVADGVVGIEDYYGNEIKKIQLSAKK